MTSRLTSPLAPFLKQLIVVLFTRPLALVQLVVSSLVIKTQMNNETDAIESLFLTVDPAYQGQGIGRNLQQALIKEARNSGYKRILGSVETWNTASIRMCHSNGFTIKNTFREGLKKRHRIEKIL